MLEAVAILLELARHDKIRLDREVKRQIHEVLLYVAKRRGTDWRVRRKIRTHAIALGEFASDYRFTVIEGWRNVLLDEQMDDQLRENAAIIVATLGEKKEDVKKELVTTMHDKDKSFWRRYSAAMALINIDHEGGLQQFEQETKRLDQAGLWADAYLGRLGKKSLSG